MQKLRIGRLVPFIEVRFTRNAYFPCSKWFVEGLLPRLKYPTLALSASNVFLRLYFFQDYTFAIKLKEYSGTFSTLLWLKENTKEL